MPPGLLHITLRAGLDENIVTGAVHAALDGMGELGLGEKDTAVISISCIIRSADRVRGIGKVKHH
ncbi:hypothetical protein SDC9_87012 [bioreactor metagenome]|uniref:Uncharacterized protein n=1 Tax=bioreactor metagenome TaxID=1076179 RepID=A0A644ZHJ1_9ZZZZ